MNISTKDKIISMLNYEKETNEIKIKSKSDIFRIDLKADNLDLWNKTLESHSSNCNLLLACERAEGKLEETRLTWVVGSAIRYAKVNNTHEAIHLLSVLGIKTELAEIASKNCPGLGEDLTWAFYLERHGWLSASPVMSAAQFQLLLEGGT